MPKNGIPSLEAFLGPRIAPHRYGVETRNDFDEMRWTCSCGAHGRWMKTERTLLEGWEKHADEETGGA